MKKINLSILACAVLSTSIYANTNEAHIKVSSATKSQQSIKDVTSNVEVITGAELKNKQITSLIDALKYIGLSVNQSGGLGQTSSFFMQGMSAEHTLVMIDGVRVNDPSVTNGYALLENIMINNIQKIEIINGAQSGIWGADAAAGVINIITKKYTKNKNLIINTEIGSFKTKKLNISLSGKDKTKYINMSLSKIKSDSFSAMSPINENIKNYENDSYESDSINIKFGFKLNENNKIDLSHSIIDASGDYDSNFNPLKGNDNTSKFNVNNKFTKINYNNINKYSNINIYKKRAVFNREVGFGVYKGDTSEIGINAKFDYMKNSFLLLGADKKVQNLDSSYSTLEGSYKSKGIFITNSNKFSGLSGGTTIFTQSLRKDNYTQFENKTTGKIGLKHHHKFIPGFTTSINYGTAYKTPSLYNLYAGYGSGNIDLEPENITSKDISLSYKGLNIKYYTSKIEDEILYSNTTYSYYQSTGISNYKGYKISYKQSLLNSILLGFTYNNQSAKDENGNDLQRRIKSSSKLSLNYFGIRKFNFGIYVNYIGERFDNKAKTIQTGKYTLVNTVINYKINKNISSYIKINNLTNKKYQEISEYTTSPRAYYIGLTAKF